MPIYVDDLTLNCPLPRIKDPQLEYIWLSLKIERNDINGYVDHSRPIRLTLVNPPRIMAIEPSILPAGDPTFDH